MPISSLPDSARDLPVRSRCFITATTSRSPWGRSRSERLVNCHNRSIRRRMSAKARRRNWLKTTNIEGSSGDSVSQERSHPSGQRIALSESVRSSPSGAWVGGAPHLTSVVARRSSRASPASWACCATTASMASASGACPWARRTRDNQRRLSLAQRMDPPAESTSSAKPRCVSAVSS